MTTLPKVPLNPKFLHQLEIMKAIADGKQVQSRMKNSTGRWYDYMPSNVYQAMNFTQFEFRIKPPEPRVFYLILRNQGDLVNFKLDEDEAKAEVSRYNNIKDLKNYQPYTYTKVVEEIKS